MIEFEGIDELLKELASIEADLPKLKKQALIESADLLKERMQKGVYSHGLNRHTGKAPDYIDRTSPRGDEIFVGNTSDGFYLFFHEEGFYNVRARRFIEPRPFASVIYEKSKGVILDEQVKVLREGLKIR